MAVSLRCGADSSRSRFSGLGARVPGSEVPIGVRSRDMASPVRVTGLIAADENIQLREPGNHFGHDLPIIVLLL